MQTRKPILILAVLVVLAVAPVLSFAQGTPAPSFTSEQLDKLVARIALYPDALLAQVLAAATYSDQIPDAARWADQHHYLTGQALADAIQADHLPWDPSVQALLPFPSVLEMMANDMSWTTDLGNAFLSQQQDVMDAVQRERRKAKDYRYLRSNAQVIVSEGPYITIVPVHPTFIPVPYYDPAIVFFPAQPGIVVVDAIRFDFFVTIGEFFRPWGWGYCRFDWDSHVVIINNAPWRRTWINRREYVHPYEVRQYRAEERLPERHVLHERTVRERAAARQGRHPVEEHREHRSR